MAPPIVTAGVPKRDDCPILTRLMAFIVDQGVVSTLQHVFRDRKGRPMDLTSLVGSGSSSVSSPDGTVALRVKEFLGFEYGNARNPVYTVSGSVVDVAKGTIQATLSSPMVQESGLYELSWAILQDSQPVAIDRSLMSVERSLWPAELLGVYRNLGPPTLQEVRMRLMDSSAADNLLLDAVEFSDDQIIHAMAEPVRIWNETPPPIKRFTTKNFPFRGAWISGMMGQLHLTAGNMYRRNRLSHSAGGTAIDDLNKEGPYLAEGQRLCTEYFAWLRNKKCEWNMKAFAGQMISAYSTLTGW